MAKVKVADTTLFLLLKNYFLVYLPCMRNASAHTIRAYRETWTQFLTFLSQRHSVQLSQVYFDMITYTSVSDFLNSLSQDRAVAASTWNLRLTAIRAFVSYASACRPEYISLAGELSAIPHQKVDRNAHVDYMTESAIQAILKIPAPTNRRELRDRVAMILLYDTGARIQELLSIRLCDLKLGSSPSVILHGKGNKTRIVPLMANTVQNLKNYIRAFHEDTCLEAKELLFYTEHKGEKTQICADTMRRRFQKYADAARAICSEVPENVHPHLWRHSRAMHLYQNGMDLTLVSQWLGHSSIETTLIYAYADTEMKRTAIERAMEGSDIISAEKYSVTDTDLLQLLYGL